MHLDHPEHVAPVITRTFATRLHDKRYREGIAGDGFFRSSAEECRRGSRPAIHDHRARRRTQVDLSLVNSKEALLWMVQMHCIDMNAWYSRVDKPDRPTTSCSTSIRRTSRTASSRRSRWRSSCAGCSTSWSYPAYVKTSGADGIHVLAPIQRRATFEETYAFAEAASRLLEERHAGLVTTEWLKKEARGRPRGSPSERVGKDDRVGVLGAAEARRSGVDAAPMGGADPGGPAARLLDGRSARTRPGARRSVSHPCSRIPGRSALRPAAPSLPGLNRYPREHGPKPRRDPRRARAGHRPRAAAPCHRARHGARHRGRGRRRLAHDRPDDRRLPAAGLLREAGRPGAHRRARRARLLALLLGDDTRGAAGADDEAPRRRAGAGQRDPPASRLPRHRRGLRQRVASGSPR